MICLMMAPNPDWEDVEVTSSTARAGSRGRGGLDTHAAG